MSRKLGDAFVRVRPDTAGFQQETTSGLSRGLKIAAAGVAAALASRKIVQGAGELVARASDLSETGNKIGVVFGGADKQMQRFARSSVERLGQTQQSALDAAATFGVFGKSAGLTDRENAKFSKGLVKLSSDMASFSNTTPEEAIEALGAGLRGESEPLRRYGVLLDDATLRNRALKMGLIETTKQALTPQQKVLAAQAEIMRQTTIQQGDFARTSGGLANQQRILSAQSETLKTEIGQGLLPLWTKTAQVMTTKVMPPAIALADKWVPKLSDEAVRLVSQADIASWADRAGDALGRIDLSKMSDGVRDFDWATTSAAFADMAASSKELAPAAKDLGSQLPGINDLLTVTGEVMGFAADNVDLLRKALPWLVAGYAAVKIAQLGSNAAQALSIPLKIADIAATRAQTKAMREFAITQRAVTGSTAAHTVAQATSNAATATSTRLTMRDRVAKIAHAAATRAAAAGTAAMAVGTRVLNAAMRANPIGLVITALVALGAGLVLAYKKSETFRNIVNGAWKVIQTAASVAWNRYYKPILGFIIGAVGKVGGAFGTMRARIGNAWDSVRDRTKGAVLFVADKVLWMAEKMLGAMAKAFGWVPGLGPKMKAAHAAIKGFREAVNKEMDAIRDEDVRISFAVGRRKSQEGKNSGFGPQASGGAGRITGAALRPATAAAGGAAMGGALTFRPQTAGALAGTKKVAGSTQAKAHAIGLELARAERTKLRKAWKKQQAAKAAAMASGPAGVAGRVLPRGSYTATSGYLARPGHYGADYAAAIGTPVSSPWAGRVTGSYDLPGSNPYNSTPYRSYGRVVKIAHSNGYSSLFAHLSARGVSSGQAVRAGQFIGRVGNNGNSTGPHLHYEARRGGSTVNPAGLGIFDRGGVAFGAGFLPKRTIRPERVLSPRQTDLHDRQTRALERLADAGPRHRHRQAPIHQHFPAATDPRVAADAAGARVAAILAAQGV